jgi:hypothetical protein
MLKRAALLVTVAALGFAAASSDAMASPKGNKHFAPTNFRVKVGGLPSGTNTRVLPSTLQPRFTGRSVPQLYKGRSSIVNGYSAEFYGGRM